MLLNFHNMKDVTITAGNGGDATAPNSIGGNGGDVRIGTNSINEVDVSNITIGNTLEEIKKYIDDLPERLSELMQYTGFRDINNKEIYEGDILKKAGIVSWNDVEARWSCIDIEWNDKREWHDMIYLTTPLEVIGNIYENPVILDEE